ncbi:MAG TPA: indole-3-glycerol phosphate synthase TrpC [Sedimentisphaerales bacterium]|nr:indole-3-glycerol phosphate synthase TrpC [Sedimentisphaerales bacterium]
MLDKIIADKREEVAARKAQTALEELRAFAAGMPRCRNFHKAVTKKNPRGINVIAEVKKASPSAGLIRPDFDPVAIAKEYEVCGADAISCLTDEKYFQGRLEYVQRIKDAVRLPVLRKDFIIDKWQVYESRAAGADAILLIGEALQPGELMDLLILATQLTMTVLIEVHGLDVMMRLRSLAGFPVKHYSLLGINNRDLATMTVDIDTTSRLAEFADDRRELVAESGIKTRADVQKLTGLGIGAVLIGETLCRSESISAKFQELFGMAQQQ